MHLYQNWQSYRYKSEQGYLIPGFVHTDPAGFSDSVILLHTLQPVAAWYQNLLLQNFREVQHLLIYFPCVEKNLHVTADRPAIQRHLLKDLQREVEYPAIQA